MLSYGCSQQCRAGCLFRQDLLPFSSQIPDNVDREDVLWEIPIDLMLLQELTPILKELSKEPIAFCSGFMSGLLKLNLTDDPVKSWLEKQAGFTATTTKKGPQSIDIE
jgi:hypothetical protein